MEVRKTFKRGKFFIDWEILRLLGQGGFTDIYLGKSRKTQKLYALKVECTGSQKKNLEHEKVVLESLQNSMLFPRFYLLNSTRKYRYLVMEALGPSLSTIRRVLNDQVFSLQTTLHVAIEMLRGIEDLHSHGFIHRDIKPANFLVRGNRASPIVLIDFGLAKRHIDPDTNQPFAARDRCGFCGTTKYASHNAHLCRDLGRRDDLISWWYSIVEMFKGHLPWSDVSDKTQTYEMKMQPNIEEAMTEGMPPEIHAIWRCIIQYSYSDEPNYRLLTSFLVQAMTNNRIDFDSAYDWEHLTARQKDHLSAVPIDMPSWQEPYLPYDLVPCVVPGEEDYQTPDSPKKKEGGCCSVM